MQTAKARACTGRATPEVTCGTAFGTALPAGSIEGVADVRGIETQESRASATQGSAARRDGFQVGRSRMASEPVRAHRTHDAKGVAS